MSDEGMDRNSDAPEPGRPVLRVVRGQPDEAEIAALAAAIAGVASAQGKPGEPEPSGLSMWADRSAQLRYPAGRRPLQPGPNAWRASALPM